MNYILLWKALRFYANTFYLILQEFTAKFKSSAIARDVLAKTKVFRVRMEQGARYSAPKGGRLPMNCRFYLLWRCLHVVTQWFANSNNP